MEESKAGGEWFKHTEKEDGSRSLIWGTEGDNTGAHGHAVIKENGNPSYIRESDGRVVADENPPLIKGW